MKALFVLLCLCAPFVVRADDHPQLAAVEAADAARLAAMKSGERSQLDAIFSNDLRYSHSTGAVDTKTSFIDVLSIGTTKYLSVDYEEKNFTFPAPGIALMTGRAKFKIGTPNGEIDPTLAFLAVWRLEDGHWRFLAWQSCKLTPPESK